MHLKGSSTRWFWPGQACIGLGWSSTSLRGWDRLSSFRQWARGPWVLECRRDDAVLEALVKPLNHQPTYRAVLAERAVLAALKGGCTLPMAAWARDLADGEAEQTGLKLLHRRGRLRPEWPRVHRGFASRIAT